MHDATGMKKYEIPKLSNKTPEAERATIVTALKSVAGVSQATLLPASHQIEITGKDQKDPKRDDIASAVSKIGFPLSAK